MDTKVLSSLIRINSKRIRYLKAQIAPYGYTGTMHLILFYIRRHPCANQEEVAGFYSLDKSSVARDARKLETLGHITRNINPDNRRSYQLELTQSGKDFLKVLDGLHEGYSEYLAEGFTEEEWKLLSALLARMAEK